jgi:hypothetical protein
VRFRATGAITYYIAHAQAYIGSEGAYNLVAATQTVSAPYIETEANPVYRAKGWEWPDWLTQNGYVEADVCLSETANPNLSSRFLLGNATGQFTPSLAAFYIARPSSDATASNTLQFSKTHTTGTPAVNHSVGYSVFDGVYRKYRIEWTNYTISGVRTVQLKLYIDGTLVNTNTPSATSWVRPPSLEIINGSTTFQTMKNIAIGSPVLPANAVPAPY